MARGWESKDVESQIESRESATKAGTPLSPTEFDTKQKRDSLLLSRTRVLNDIQRACHTRHKDQLFSALNHLDTELEKLAATSKPVG